MCLQEEIDDRPRVGTLISSLANYSNTLPSAPADPDAKPTPQGGAGMGTLIGVYLPCIQNIFGVILFIRLTWVVGTAGAVMGFLIVFTCCCVVRAIAENRKFSFSRISRGAFDSAETLKRQRHKRQSS